MARLKNQRREPSPDARGDTSAGYQADESLPAGADTSPVHGRHVAAGSRATGGNLSQDVPTTGACGWCGGALFDVRAKFCGRKCRQSAFRLRGRRGVTWAPADTGPLAFAYADPPYPGLSKRYYGDQASYAGEVDHGQLITSLRARHDAGELAGWALSTAGRSLQDLLPLCPPGVHVAVWVKDLEVPPATRGPHYRWEAVIVSGGRKMQPGIRDWVRTSVADVDGDVLEARPARLGGHDLPGRKPIKFWAWLFDLLGMVPGDRFEDMFPGTGTGARAWAHLSATAAADTSVLQGRRVVLSRTDAAVAASRSEVVAWRGQAQLSDGSDATGGT